MDDTPLPGNDLLWHRLMGRRREVKAIEVICFFRQKGIEPILIKGWASARYYPESHPRAYGDVDLAVSRNDYDAASRLLLSSPHHRLGVDLHCELRHLDTLAWEQCFKESHTHEVDGTPVRILRPEDHLRVISTHWLNDGAAPKERLWDIYYAIENRPVNFDWERCLDVVSWERRSWVVAAVGMAHRYLGLNIDDLPFASDARSLPGWLIKAAENEWESDTRLIDLELCVHNRKLLIKQLRKRFPPNPIQATIETGGPIDHGSRLRYQVADVVKRAGPSVRRIGRELLKRAHHGN